MKDHVLAVDLGGTNMRAAVVDPSGQILMRMAEPTPQNEACPDALERLMETVRDKGGGRGSYETVVVGVPGRVDYCRGELEYAPNLPSGWAPELTETCLSSHFDAPVRLANDADLAAVGEAYFGAGQPFVDVVYVTISTGIGAGIVLDGQLMRGTRSFGEIGHTILALGHLNQGEPATAEQLAAGPALSRYAHELGLQAEGHEIVALVNSGAADAKRAWEHETEAIAAVVVNLAHLFSPDAVVIGGGVGRNGALLLEPVAESLEQYGPQHLRAPVVAIEAALGDDPGLIGAAAWALAIGVT